MTMPSGATPSERKYSQWIKDSLHAIITIIDEGNANINLIKQDPDYTVKERQAAIKRVQDQTIKRTEPHVKNLEKYWNKVQKEFVVLGAGKADRKELLTAMEIILSSQGMLTEETLQSTLKPIENDITAIRTVYPIIEKTGLINAFKGSHADMVLKAAGRLENAMNRAHEAYESLIKSYGKQGTLLAMAIGNNLFVDTIKTAENAYEEVRKVINANV